VITVNDGSSCILEYGIFTSIQDFSLNPKNSHEAQDCACRKSKICYIAENLMFFLLIYQTENYKVYSNERTDSFNLERRGETKSRKWSKKKRKKISSGTTNRSPQRKC